METNIPAEVIKAYELGTLDHITPLTGGIVNTTVRATYMDGSNYVFQKINPTIDPRQTEDYAVIAEHLTQEGWVVPQVVSTQDGAHYTSDETGANWRVSRFVESDPHSHKQNFEESRILAHKYGTLLAKLHISLQKLDYTPTYGIAHFHDTQHYVKQLQGRQHLLSDKAKILTHHAFLGLLSEKTETSTTHLIHADPKLNNVLKRRGTPFTFIDWDTAMVGSPMLDLGDMLRSLMKENDAVVKPIKHALLGVDELIEGYRTESGIDPDPHRFRNKALRATASLVLELAMRYLIDSTEPDEEGYFSWDRTNFASRHDFSIRQASEGILRFDYLRDCAENCDEDDKWYNGD